jgi:hypothetical protein
LGAKLDIQSINGRPESGLVIQHIDCEVYLDFE